MGWASHLPNDRLRAVAEQHYPRGAAGENAMPIRAFATWPETEAWAGQQIRDPAGDQVRNPARP